MSAHTPDKAKSLWCPMVGGSGSRCIADQCAAWRWVPATASLPVRNDGFTTFEIKATQTHGYCGLAGVVQ